VISLTGNTRAITATANGAAERKSESWILAARVQGAYGEGRAAGTGRTEVLAEAAGVQARGDYRVTPRYSGYALGGGDFDHVKSVEVRSVAEGGAAALWLEPAAEGWPRTTLRTDLAVRHSRELRFQYFPTRADIPDVTLVAPKLGLGFRLALSEGTTFSEDAEVLANVRGDERYLATSLTKISVGLLKGLSVATAFEVRHDSAPAPGKVRTDTILSVLLALETGS
jgi:hypothetical protein